MIKGCLSTIFSLNFSNSLVGVGRICFPRLQKIKRSTSNLPVHLNCVTYLHTTAIFCKRRKTAEERKSPRIIEYSPKSKQPLVEVWKDITVAELAQVLGRDTRYIHDIFLGLVAHPNSEISDVNLLNQALRRSGHRMKLIAKPHDVTEEIIEKDVFPRPPPTKDQLKPRPPVVTVMGHVDHGKTTLLDALRNSRVVEQEFGGITQHIGAFSVALDTGSRVTFLDTPGHAAFSAMRARGANATDIVVLVVAADDGVMEQTIESVRMARQANVPILVAINKIDAPNANIERTERMLLEAGIQIEKMGGDVQAIPISALKKQNLDKLKEALVLQAELLEIKADYSGPVEAVVVESKVHPHRGRLCTVVVQRGTLKNGAILIADTAMAKVRLLRDDKGEIQKEVTPGYPTEVEGWRDLPPAGELVLEVETEKRAKEAIKVRNHKKQLEQQEKDSKAIAAKEEQHQREYKEKLALRRKMGRFKLKPEGPRKPEIERGDCEPSLNLVIKADVDGTLEAILDTLDTYDSELCKMDMVNYGVGAVTETDIELAEAFNGVIYAFNVECSKSLTEKTNVPIKKHNIIYKLVEDVKEELNKRLPPKEVEEVLGEASVLQQFDINEGRKKVSVAGCRCTNGFLKRSAMFRLVRDGQTLYEGPLSSLRHFKSEVDTIKKDVECGLQLMDKTIAFQQGDIIVCFEKKTMPQVTDWKPPGF